jgi:multidrug resistance protein MdtO
MATHAATLPHRKRFFDWFAEFLKQELAPYPGRGAVVARMVISATLTMIILVTFRIPGGAVGALCAFILSRENLASTAKSGFSILAAFVLGALFIPIGARMFASIPFTHFMWEGVSVFVAFFLLRTLTNFPLAIALCLVSTNILSIWYLPGPAEHNVEQTLWQVLGTAIGVAVTITVEAVSHSFSRRDELADGINVRLKFVESLLRDYAAGRAIAPETDRALAQYVMVGVGSMRSYITRSNFDQLRRIQMSAIVALTGRTVDFAAALSSTQPTFAPTLQLRAAVLADRVAQVREALAAGQPPLPWKDAPDESRTNTPLLSELESMVALMPSVFESESSVDPRLEILEQPPAHRFLVDDAFTNPDHLRFVLGGTLAAMACYILYVGLDWPGISTSVTTCVLTGLSNIGSSRQKQVLRIIGASLGGFVFGLGAQVFILPYIDSITGFTVLFAFVTAVAAWVVTSSPRLSYAGLQIALAFYLINLSDFTIQLSLTVARDRAIGVLLGISMMWLVFERFYPKPASDQMVRVFIKNLRLMATLVEESGIGADANTIVQIRRHREQIYRNFGEATAQADAVPFETGPKRAAHMAARDRIRLWQPTLRTFYLLEVPLLQFRLFSDPGHISEPFRSIERRFLDACHHALNDLADDLEHQLQGEPYVRPSHIPLKDVLEEAIRNERHGPLPAKEQALLGLTAKLALLVDGLTEQVAAAPLFATD